MNHTVDIITVSGNACALVLTVLLLIGTLAGGNLGSKINRRFLAMLGFCIPGSLIEMVYPILQYVPGAGVAVSRNAVSFADFFCRWFVHRICHVPVRVSFRPRLHAGRHLQNTVHRNVLCVQP